MQEAEPLKYLPWIGAGIFVVFWGASQVVQAYAGPVCHSAGKGAEVSFSVNGACRGATTAEGCPVGQPVQARIHLKQGTQP